MSVRHKGLLRLLESDDARGIGADRARRVRNILATLLSAKDITGINGPPGWHVHELGGDRTGTWSISATGNWRITFRIEGGTIADLDLEDYH